MNFDSNKSLVFVGDNHGDWNEIFYFIRSKGLENCNLVSVGDLGVGFKYRKEYEYKNALLLNNSFKQYNINFYGIRGNHDNPLFFSGKDRINLSNFELLEDYTIAQHKDQTIQFVGGAISIDRTGRTEGSSYWSEEKVAFKKSKCQKVDILVTHTAPSFCFPRTFNEIVYGWAEEDSALINDLTKERNMMDKIFEICQPSFHVYGHFHASWTEQIKKCKHKLLNINEAYEKSLF